MFKWLQETFIDKKINPRDLDNVLVALDIDLKLNVTDNYCIQHSKQVTNQKLIMKKFKYVDPEKALGPLRKRIEFLDVRDDLVNYLIGKKKLNEINKKYEKIEEKPEESKK